MDLNNSRIRPEDIIRSAEACLTLPPSLPPLNEKTQTATCPSFPLDVFPREMQAIARSFHEYEGFNKDFLCAAMLTVFASAMGNRWTAHFSTSWYATPILYVVVIGPASCGKTPPLHQMTEPLRRYDLELDAAYNTALQRYDLAMSLNREERISRGLDEQPVKPRHRQVLVINTNIENLFSTLDQNRRGILMNVDELESLTGNMSRYTNGTDESYWLEMFNGSQIKYARKSTGEYINIAHPYVSVIGGTQPGVLPSMFGSKRSSNGFAARFLKVYPDITRMPDWNMQKMPESVAQDWDDIIRSVLTMEYETDANGDPQPQVVEFSPEALQKLITWKNTVNGKAWGETDSEYVKGVCGKLETYVVRFCLIIQVMRSVCDGAGDSVIDEVSAYRAILLAEYFRRMDLRAFNLIRHQPVDELHQQLLDKLPEVFTTADAMALGSLLGTSESTVKRFLRDGVSQQYLKKDRHGSYCKA